MRRCAVAHKRRWFHWKRLARLLVLLLVLWVMWHWLERHLVYIPSRSMAATGAELGGPFEDVYLNTTDGVHLNGWFFPARTHTPRSRLVFLLLHGNAGNISHRLDYYQHWLDMGVNVFALDYRGYGRSQGRPSEEGTYRDAQAAYAWLRQKGFAATNIIALGESLGGGVASELALREALGGLILQCTFTSIPDVGKELYPWLPVRWLCSIRYDTRAKLPLVNCPVLILHSREDTMIRFHHAEQNLAAANPPKMLAELKGDHNNVLDADPGRYREGFEKFIAAHFE